MIKMLKDMKDPASLQNKQQESFVHFNHYVNIT